MQRNWQKKNGIKSDKKKNGDQKVNEIGSTFKRLHQFDFNEWANLEMGQNEHPVSDVVLSLATL